MPTPFADRLLTAMWVLFLTGLYFLACLVCVLWFQRYTDWDDIAVAWASVLVAIPVWLIAATLSAWFTRYVFTGAGWISRYIWGERP